MKKIILSISLAFIASSLLAQKAEIEAANSAFQSKNYTQALEHAQAAETKLTSNRTIEPKLLADFYKNAATAAKNAGKLALAAKYYGKLGQLESKPYYESKNKDSKQTEYFWNKAEAEKITSAGNYSRLKERKPQTSYMRELGNEISDKANQSLAQANDAFNAKNYNLSGDKFLESYYLTQALGNPNDILKYYAGVSYLQTKDQIETATELLQELIDDGFTGVQERYYAQEKDSNNEVSFGSKADMDAQVKLGLYKNPRIEKTESIEEDLYSNTVYGYYNTKQYEKGIEVAKKGLAKYPDNENMNQLLSGMYYNSGNSAEFIADLENKVKNDTATAIDYFNLARQLEDDGKQNDVVRNYYKKSIEKDPNFSSAYLNLAYNIISEEKPYVEAMNNNLGTSAKEKKIYKENQEKRVVLYKEALPYLEKAYQISPDNLVVIRVLRNSYDVVGNDDKFLEMKKILDEKESQ